MLFSKYVDFFSFNAVSNINLNGKAIVSPQIFVNLSRYYQMHELFMDPRFFIIDERPLFIGVNVDAKKLLNILALVQNSEANLPLISNF